MSTAIWWIRRDLRLTDNQALQAAMSNAEQVIPAFVLDQQLLDSRYVGEKRLAFLFAGLRALDARLRQLGSYLVLRKGEPRQELRKLLEESGASGIYAEPDYSPFARTRDERLSVSLPLNWAGSPAVLPPGFVVKPDGQPYTVFTPFRRAWEAALDLKTGRKFFTPTSISTPIGLRSLTVPDEPRLSEKIPFMPGEEEAQKRLERFTGSNGLRGSPIGLASPGDFDAEATVFSYETGRNRLDLEGTSQLSPYLRFGMVSARQAIVAALTAIKAAESDSARKSADIWLSELIWREFYIHILHFFPLVRRRNFRLGDIRWENDRQKFLAWKEGRTGYPVVDAAMRQLVESGWMHNRARMITASFLTKDLLIDWRWGEQWFMQHLIDGDPAANNGGWQWTAGTGTDAAPYFRVFNPVSQSLKHDPEGKYIRRWLPELRNVPNEYIHQPWLAPVELQNALSTKIGVDYPKPIVDHAIARERALKAYKQNGSE